MLFSFLFNPINKGPCYSKTSLVSYSNKKLSKSFKDYDIRDTVMACLFIAVKFDDCNKFIFFKLVNFI